MISVYNRQKDLRLNKSKVKALVEAVLHFEEVSCEEVSVYFVTKKKIKELHEEFFQDPTPTDCISFPLNAIHLGEIFVCPKVAMEYAEQSNLDPFIETSLYIVHGLLHLMGFDDLQESERRIMRKKEKECMDHLSTLKLNLSPP